MDRPWIGEAQHTLNANNLPCNSRIRPWHIPSSMSVEGELKDTRLGQIRPSSEARVPTQLGLIRLMLCTARDKTAPFLNRAQPTKPLSPAKKAEDS